MPKIRSIMHWIQKDSVNKGEDNFCIQLYNIMDLEEKQNLRIE